MNDNNYRELQLSSTHLILIFLGIIILGIVIFLLGISVGKKQADLTQKTNTPAQHITEQTLVQPPPETIKPENNKDSQPIQKEAAKSETKPEQPQKAEAKKNRYYIQVGAYSKKEGAIALAEDFQKKGFPTVILDPFPTDRRAIFRVRIGGYNTREEALKAKQDIMKLTGKKATNYFIKFVK